MSPDSLKALIQAEAKAFRRTLADNGGEEIRFVILVADTDSEKVAFATNTTDETAMTILELVLNGTKEYYETFPYRTDVN